jgi:hypothetical protein
MSTPTIPSPAATPPPYVAPARPTRSPGAVVAIVLGSILALLGATAAIAGGAVAAIFGDDGALSTGRHDLGTPTAALVSEPAAIDGTDGVSDVLGNTRLRVSASADGGKPVFVGVGPADEVDRYLSGVAVDEVTDFDVDPFTVDRDRHPGSDAPAGVPGAQDFWVARGTSDGTSQASVDWKVRDGDYRFVVMNADGTPNVQTRSKLGIKIPHIAAIGTGVLIGGAIVMLGGVAALTLGLRRPKD